MTFHNKVKGLCDQRGISITALTAAFGFSASTGTTWKASKRLPRPSTMKKVADYFEMTVEQLKEGIDFIDYENYDTSGFNQRVYNQFLEKCNGDTEQAVKSYIEFEKVQADDAMNDPDRLAIYQNNGENYGLIGNAHAPVEITNSRESNLSEQESEMLRIFSELSFVDKSKVIVYAAELKNKSKKPR